VSLRPKECRVYRFRPDRPGAHLILSHGAPAGGEGDGGQLTHGLFGVVVVERAGSRWYRSQVTAEVMVAANLRHRQAKERRARRRRPNRPPAVAAGALVDAGQFVARPGAELAGAVRPLIALLRTSASANAQASAAGALAALAHEKPEHQAAIVAGGTAPRATVRPSSVSRHAVGSGDATASVTLPPGVQRTGSGRASSTARFTRPSVR
jgi:hypothetical protein